jgi:RNA polymerase sigma-70 factor (ECF subfamily)
MRGPSDSERLAAIERAYDDEYRRFLRVAVAMLGDVERARDAVQETFARALRSRGDLRRLESLSGWLWRILVNVCRIESRHPSPRLGDDWDVPAETETDDEWLGLRAVIATLPERQRLVLFLRHYADLDYEQIAHAIGVERGTVAATLHQAHEKVRTAIAKEVSR